MKTTTLAAVAALLLTSAAIAQQPSPQPLSPQDAAIFAKERDIALQQQAQLLANLTNAQARIQVLLEELKRANDELAALKKEPAKEPPAAARPQKK